MKTSMREMSRRRAERKAGTPEGTRNPNIVSPYQQRAKARAWADDKQVEPELVVVPEDVRSFDKMCATRPMKPPPVTIPERNDAARVAARRDRNGIA
jgi:hypothetical protein